MSKEVKSALFYGLCIGNLIYMVGFYLSGWQFERGGEAITALFAYLMTVFLSICIVGLFQNT